MPHSAKRPVGGSGKGLKNYIKQLPEPLKKKKCIQQNYVYKISLCLQHIRLLVISLHIFYYRYL